MGKLLQALKSLARSRSDMAQAVANVRADIRSAEHPHGNLTPALVAGLEEACEKEQTIHDAIADHRSSAKPELHRKCTPTDRVSRAMSRPDFISYHVLDGSADLSEQAPWLAQLTVGAHRFEGGDFRGRTGREDHPCWWRLEEAGRIQSEDGRAHATELALSEDVCRRAARDGTLVEVTLVSEIAADAYFKPTALEGFGPNTLFRPELTGSSYGRTAPVDPAAFGWPEVVSQSAAYAEIASDDTEITVCILPYRMS